MTIRKEVQEKVQEAVAALNDTVDIAGVSVDVPEDPAHGDYATNAALVLAGKLKRKPMDVAAELAEKLTDSRWDVSVATPGFVNVKLKNAFLAERLQGVDEKWGKSNKGEGKTVMVEYFQLNIAKRPHIGHLRSAVIGDALKRILLSQGYHAVSDTHVGDWGTQFGILLLGYKEFVLENGDRARIAEDPFALLEDVYTKENTKIEADPARRDLAKEEFAKLEHGDKENREIWEWMLSISMKKLYESADRLDLLAFDEHKGESSYEADMPAIVEYALQKGVAIKKEDGAVVVDLSSEKLDEAVLVKSDGASTYLLRDLATIQHRKKHWDFLRNLYVVDVRQSHHFKQLFRVAECLGYEGVGDSKHVEFGFMKLLEGAISTRKGTAIALDKLLDEAEKRAREIIRDKNPDLTNADDVARTVGLGAIKYFDLSHNRTSDVVFEWDRALSFEGNTGPYMQYTHARFASILRKTEFSEIQSPQHWGAVIFGDVEHRLCTALLRLPEAIEDALAMWSPHILAAYLYNLAQVANEFYHACPVLQEDDEVVRAFRLALVNKTAITIKNGLHLLGIEAPEEM